MPARPRVNALPLRDRQAGPILLAPIFVGEIRCPLLHYRLQSTKSVMP